jgi:hypothetical protein
MSLRSKSFHLLSLLKCEILLLIIVIIVVVIVMLLLLLLTLQPLVGFSVLHWFIPGFSVFDEICTVNVL